MMTESSVDETDAAEIKYKIGDVEKTVVFRRPLEIAKLELKPSDILVVRIPCGHATREALVEAAQYFESQLPPDIHVLLINDETELSVLSRAEAAGETREVPERIIPLPTE